MKHMALKILVVILILLVTHIVSGCGMLWKGDLLIVTIGKKFDLKDVELISEPNYLQIGSEVYKSESKDVKLITPAVGIEIGD